MTELHIYFAFGLFLGLFVGGLLGAQLAWFSSPENPKRKKKQKELEQVWFEHTVGQPDDLP